MNNEQKKPMDTQKTIKILTAIIVVLCLILVGLIVWLVTLIFDPWKKPVEPQPSESTAATTIPEETTAPTEPLVMLDNMAEIYATNNEFAGWLRIDDTVIDYPVMHTPDDPEKYLRKDFNGKYSMEGTLFIGANCSLVPESDNTIIYGHNMQRGTMFHTLMEYKDKEFWEEHPEIFYSTLYEERNYEIVAAFYDRVYYKHENDVFKFYRFIDAENEEQFNEAMAYYKENALYDTGVTAEYGDKLLTLVTCSYHERYGRFVVVAREKAEEPVQPTDPVETTGSTAPTE